MCIRDRLSYFMMDGIIKSILPGNHEYTRISFYCLTNRLEVDFLRDRRFDYRFEGMKIRRGSYEFRDKWFAKGKIQVNRTGIRSDGFLESLC